MAENSAVFLGSVGKAEHPAQIHPHFFKVGVEEVSTPGRIAEIPVHSPHNLGSLLIGGGARHQGKDLTGQHHPHQSIPAAFHRTGVVVVIAVEPVKISAVVYPFTGGNLFLQIPAHGSEALREPVSGNLSLGGIGKNIFAELHQGFPLLRPAHGCKVSFQQCLQTGKDGQFAMTFSQPADQLGKGGQVAGIGSGKGHAFALLGCHVQTVVPVCTPQPHVAVLSHVKESRDILQQQVLQNGTLSHLNSIFTDSLLTPVEQGVSKVFLIFKEEVGISRFVQIHPGGKEGPETVIHPDTGDVVPVCLELTGTIANDGSVGAIQPDAGKMAEELIPNGVRLGEDQRQAVLPQIPPTTAATAVIVMGQEAASADPAQNRLDAHPTQPARKLSISGVHSETGLFRPVTAGTSQGSRNSAGQQISAGIAVNAHDNLVAGALAGLQDFGGKEQGSGHLASLYMITLMGFGAGIGRIHHGFRPEVAAGSHIVLGHGHTVCRGNTVFIGTPDMIGDGVLLMAAFVKGQGGCHIQAIGAYLTPVKQAGDMTVIPDVIGGTAIKRNGSSAADLSGFLGGVNQGHLHNFGFGIICRHKAENPGQNTSGSMGALHTLPEHTAPQGAVFTAVKAMGHLRGTLSYSGPGLSIAVVYPEIAGSHAVCQALLAVRSQQKAVLTGFGIASQQRGDAGDHPGFVDQREIDFRRVLSSGQFKIAILI